MMTWAQLWQHLQNDILPFGIRIIVAIIILTVGFWLAMVMRKLVGRALLARHVEHTVRIFISHLTYAVILAFVFIAVLAQLGVQTTSLIAVMSAAVFAIMLSLKNSLSSLASGILLVIFRPFKVGDKIQVGSYYGTVEEIQLMFTIISTSENQLVYIPNEKLSANEVINFSQNPIRRQDVIISVGYDDDLKKVKVVLEDILAHDRRVLTMPAKPLVAVEALADSSVNLLVRFWASREDFDAVRYDLLETIKLRFDVEGISIPYPQQELHVNQKSPV